MAVSKEQLERCELNWRAKLSSAAIAWECKQALRALRVIESGQFSDEQAKDVARNVLNRIRDDRNRRSARR